MDGNRRWAKNKGLPSSQGHKAGLDNLKKITKVAAKLGVEHLVVYAFSTENWKRSESEVNFLMDLLKNLLSTDLKEVLANKAKVRVIGELDMLDNELKQAIQKAEAQNANAKHTLWVALSYGGRLEIARAAQSAARATAPENISEENFKNFLWSKDLPDLDIIIRTGGHKRLSNFMLWHAAYAELFFTDTFWPDFSEQEFTQILHEFTERQRNFGK